MLSLCYKFTKVLVNYQECIFPFDELINMILSHIIHFKSLWTNGLSHTNLLLKSDQEKETVGGS